jgi:hypothetical protein
VVCSVWRRAQHRERLKQLLTSVRFGIDTRCAAWRPVRRAIATSATPASGTTAAPACEPNNQPCGKQARGDQRREDPAVSTLPSTGILNKPCLDLLVGRRRYRGSLDRHNNVLA